MTKFIKKPLSILLAALMIVGVFAALPISASAETITTVTNSHDISINSDTTITGTASNTKITVTGDCTIILDGLNLTNTSNRGKCGIDIKSGTVNLIIKGENKITAGGQNGDACPIGVRENATLIISGYNNENDGNILNVIGTTNGKAAIGGAWDQWTCGTIVINSGTINAKGGGYGAAVIGKGGSKNSTKSVTINGGVITTTLLDTQQGATAIGGGNMSVSYSPSYDTPLIMNGVMVYPTVTWMNYDGTELKKDEIVAEDTTPSYDGATPEKAEDDDYTYTFSGWTDGTNTYGLTDTLPVVTGNVTYTATYTANEKPVITWNNWDGTTFKSDHVNVGAVPSYDGETPTKDGVTFAGWTDSHGVFYAKDATLPEVTADETYTAVFELTIGSVDEWNSFAASVKGGNTYSGIIVRMTADVGPVTTMVDGTFSGTFDGDGHTLTVNISGGSTSAATFAYVKDATIQNLRLEGTVTSSGIHTAALVKAVSDTGSTCTIKNVDIYADVNCSNNYIGGFIGHAGTANTVNIENSIFAGSINKTGATQGFIGAFIGWSQTLTATIKNCAFTGSYNNIKSFNNIGFSYNAPTKVTVSGFYSNASEVFVANVNHGTRLYVPSSSYPTTVALVKNNDGETFYSAFSDALAAWTDGSTLALLADVTCDSLITVPAADTKTLDLNGNALSLSYSSTKVEVNGTLTIQSTASGGSITPTSKSRVINVVDGGTLNIESGTINGYNADRAVIGGVGTINFNGGKIVTPASNAFSPDGVATLNLNGGEIECTSDSTSMGTATAVWAHGDSTINWNGTAITTNTGDGIRMKSAGNGTVNVTGGSFTATSSSLPEEGGYAVYVNSNMSSLNLKGNPSFSGRGIYLTNDKVINITDELSNTNPISVTMQTPGVFTSGLSGNGDASNFANGNGTGYALTLNASGEAQIVSTYTITWNNWDDTELEKDTGVAEGATPEYNGATPQKPDDATNYYTFSGWDPEVSAVTGDETYTAQFTAAEKPEVIKDCNNKYGNFRLYSNVPIVSLSNAEDLLTGAIIPITYGDGNTLVPLVDAKGYSYKLYNQTGTEIPFEITSSNSEPGSGYWLSDDVTVYTNVLEWTLPANTNALYIVATEPAPAPVEVFTKHSITLGGDIGVNFFLDKTAYDNLSGTKTVKFVLDKTEYTGTVRAYDDEKYVVTCDVVAAQMAHTITATLYVDGEAVDTDDYSVQQYAETVYANPSAYDSEKPEQLKAVAEALLHYGAMAQTVFAASLEETPDHLADVNMPAADFSGATAENIAAAIKGSASDLNTAAAAFDAEFYTSSLIYLSRNTLRLYFTPASKTVGALNGLDFSGNLSEYYYFKDVENIPAAELDNQQPFSVNGTEFTFSALDYAKAVVESTKMEPEQQNLAKALYLYNMTANDYFDAAPAPAQKIVDLSTLEGDYEAQNNDVLTGALEGNKQITIADGATVTLKDATITSLTNAAYAGINPVGDATILLEGENTVKGGHRRMPGIYIPANKTLTIDGTGSLVAYSGGDFSATSYSDTPASCGIGGKRNLTGGDAVAGGNLVINGGTITAYGGLGCAGIGGCTSTTSTKMFGDITINGGTVTASALDNAAGIGSGKVTSCGNITITGGTVTATGDGYAAGIGSGAYGASCGDITIADTVTLVTATKGEDATNSIGAGDGGTCGTVTIGGVEGAITDSPYIYEP